MTVTKGKDNIPSWDGNPASWTEYRKAAYLYEETVKWENRYLCGPWLAAELSGAAKAAISNKKRGWLSRRRNREAHEMFERSDVGTRSPRDCQPAQGLLQGPPPSSRRLVRGIKKSTPAPAKP